MSNNVGSMERIDNRGGNVSVGINCKSKYTILGGLLYRLETTVQLEVEQKAKKKE